MEKTIYPLIRTEEMADYYLLETSVRKQADDKYYLTKLTKKVVFGDITEKEKTNKVIDGIKQLNIEAFIFLFRGIVDVESGLFELDENQESEENRLSI